MDAPTVADGRSITSGEAVVQSQYLVTPYKIFVEGDALYDSMIDDICRARHRVLLETYIFRSDQVGQKFIDALVRAAKKGVDVDLHVDAFGSLGVLSKNAIQYLRKSGVNVQWSYEWNWRRPYQYNRRNHRKILLIDDRAVFLGGYNIGKENSAAAHGPTRWRDTHIRLPGRFVGPTLAILGQSRRARNIWCPDWRKNSFLIPNYGRKCRYRLRCLLQRGIEEARERIWITTPYFVVNRHMRKTLRSAADRGVDVRLLVPEKSDVALARWAAHLSYDGLLRANVKIYEFQDRVLHAKTMLIDHDWTMIGSSNFDYRSFYVNDEINFVSNTSGLNSVFSQVFEADMCHAKAVSQLVWLRRPLCSRIAEFVGWILRKWL